jgi:osmotically-inducible protein OsmY
MSSDPDGLPSRPVADEEPREYTEAHVAEALASDPRVSLLGIDVTIRSTEVFLSGDVGTPQRKHAVGEVVAEMLPGYTIHNDTSAEDLAPGIETEHLS